MLILLIGLVVLSRLLSPAEFGYVAIAVSIVGFGEILRDFGLTSAAIRSPDLTCQQRDVLFWLNLALGVFLAVLAVALANPLSILFSTPQLGLALPALASVFVFNGATAQYRASLNRNMQYGSIALLDMVGPPVGLGAAIVAAAMGASYWALVIQVVAAAFATMVLAIALGRWMPRLPRRRTGAGEMVRFGSHVALSQLFSYGGNNVDVIALGLFTNAQAVGLYSRAYQMVMTPLNQLKSPAVVVAIPALSRVADDASRSMRYLLKGQAVIGYGIVPVAVLLAGAAIPVIEIVMGDQWRAAAPIVALLACAGALQQLSGVANWIFVARGLGGDLRNYSIVAFVLKVAGVLSLIWAGPVGVAAGYLIAVALSWPLALVWSAKRAGLPAAPLLLQAIRLLVLGLLSGAATAVVVDLASGLGHVISLLLASGAMVAVYLVALVVPVVRRDVIGVTRTLKMAIARRSSSKRVTVELDDPRQQK